MALTRTGLKWVPGARRGAHLTRKNFYRRLEFIRTPLGARKGFFYPRQHRENAAKAHLPLHPPTHHTLSTPPGCSPGSRTHPMNTFFQNSCFKFSVFLSLRLFFFFFLSTLLFLSLFFSFLFYFLFPFLSYFPFLLSFFRCVSPDSDCSTKHTTQFKNGLMPVGGQELRGLSSFLP